MYRISLLPTTPLEVTVFIPLKQNVAMAMVLCSVGLLVLFLTCISTQVVQKGVCAYFPPHSFLASDTLINIKKLVLHILTDQRNIACKKSWTTNCYALETCPDSPSCPDVITSITTRHYAYVLKWSIDSSQFKKVVYLLSILFYSGGLCSK